ncbi:MAG: hypothetical protein NTZ78_03790 [Candidatus Aureabacteria bacterium]|nr:hypothetical protein [Candidatus Auribacterota bacterium]
MARMVIIASTCSHCSNDGRSKLSGYAWSEITGWINFRTDHSRVCLYDNGQFYGYSWGENEGGCISGPAGECGIWRRPIRCSGKRSEKMRAAEYPAVLEILKYAEALISQQA